MSLLYVLLAYFRIDILFHYKILTLKIAYYKTPQTYTSHISALKNKVLLTCTFS